MKVYSFIVDSEDGSASVYYTLDESIAEKMENGAYKYHQVISDGYYIYNFPDNFDFKEAGIILTVSEDLRYYENESTLSEDE